MINTIIFLIILYLIIGFLVSLTFYVKERRKHSPNVIKVRHMLLIIICLFYLYKMEDKILYNELKENDVYETLSNDVWVKCKIVFHWRGQPMKEILEGVLKGKQWYLFPDLKNLRRVI